MAVAREREESILATISDTGAPSAHIIGFAEEGAPAIRVETSLR